MKKRGISLLKVLFPLSLMFIIINQGRHEFSRLNIVETLHLIIKLPGSSRALLLLASMAAVFCMTGYDWIVARRYGERIKAGSLLRVSWIANTFNNLFGFAGLTGSSVRVILYMKLGMEPKQAVYASSVLLPSYATGLSLLALALVTGVLPYHNLYPIHGGWFEYGLWLMSAYIAVYILIQRSPFLSRRLLQREQKVAWSVVLGLAVISLAEWLAAVGVFYIALLTAGYQLPLHQLAGVFAISAIIGIISMVPGGLGTFDASVIIGLQQLGIPSDGSLAILLLFRFFYYFIPWIAGLVLSVQELSTNAGNNMGVISHTVLKAWGWTGRLISWPERFTYIQNIGIWSLSALTFMSGILLLFNEFLLNERLHAFRISLPPAFIIGSHYLSVSLGALLLVVSRGIYYRTRRAYSVAMLIIAASIFFSLIKGISIRHILYFGLVYFLLRLSRKGFYRKSVPLQPATAAVWGAVTAVILFGYWLLSTNTYRLKVLHHHILVKPLFISPPVHLQAAVLATGLTWLLLGIYTGIKPERTIGHPFDEEEKKKLFDFLKKQSGNVYTHLILLGDKRIFWGQENEVLIPYAVVGDKLVALGDPLGPWHLIRNAIKEFREYADTYAMFPVFYEISSQHLADFHENGFRFFKLGEDATVDLTTFSLSGKDMKSFRNVKNRLQKEGYSFSFIEPPFAPELMHEMRQVSDIWSKEKKSGKKYFSMGRFEDYYIQSAPVVTLRDAKGNLTGFVSIMPCYDHETISIDLMRHVPETPNGTMDGLFLFLFEWAGEHGYKKFNLGMAPLANVGRTAFSFREEKVLGLIYRHINTWYGFQGLRRYKEKFSPHWEPRFLAYPGNVSLVSVFIDILFLINGQNRKTAVKKMLLPLSKRDSRA